MDIVVISLSCSGASQPRDSLLKARPIRPRFVTVAARFCLRAGLVDQKSQIVQTGRQFCLIIASEETDGFENALVKNEGGQL